jgi:hypothetical protein
MSRKISFALAVAALSTVLVAGNGASAKEAREAGHGPVVLKPEHPGSEPLTKIIRNPNPVYIVGPGTPKSPPLPGPGGPVPTTGGGGGGFTDLPGPPVVCLGEEWRCKQSMD